MKRVVILTDSLGRARPDLDKENRTYYHEVYGKILKDKLGSDFDVELCYIESLDTRDAVFYSERMVAFREPDIVIYQLGINDCVPRIFKKSSSSIILKKTFRIITKDVFLKTVSKYRGIITRLIPKTYVTETEFENNFKKMIAKVEEFNPTCIFFCIAIAEVNKDFLKKSPNANHNVGKYNTVLRKIFKDHFIDINSILCVEQLHIADGIHLTRVAHKKLAEYLILKLKTIK